MSDQEPERITIIASSFSAAALEHHRGRMSARGYLMDGPILERKFMLSEGVEPAKDMFEGKTMFSVSFVKREQAKPE